MNLAGLEADHPICRSGVVESLKQSVQSFGKWEVGRWEGEINYLRCLFILY